MIPTPEQMLAYPQATDEEMHMIIAQLVHMLHANEPSTVPVSPNTFVLDLRLPARIVSSASTSSTCEALGQ